MVVYTEFDSVYGPYVRKDNRKHVVLIAHNDTGQIIRSKTVSYPKYLVECYLDKYLEDTDTIDHIDGDYTNNDLSNLRIVPRSIHCLSHTSSRRLIQKECLICKKSFYTLNSWRVTCGSKRCVGKCTHMNGPNKGCTHIDCETNITSNRYLLDVIPTVAALAYIEYR